MTAFPLTVGALGLAIALTILALVAQKYHASPRGDRHDPDTLGPDATMVDPEVLRILWARHDAESRAAQDFIDVHVRMAELRDRLAARQIDLDARLVHGSDRARPLDLVTPQERMTRHRQTRRRA